MDNCPLLVMELSGYSIGMAKTFRTAFLEALELTGWSVPEVTRRSGVSTDQLNKLKQRENAKTNVDDAQLVANAFGYTLDEFLSDTLAQDRDETAALWRQLTERERQLIRNAAQDLPSLGHEAS